MSAKFYQLKKWLLALMAVVGLSAAASAQYCNSSFTNVTYEFVTNVTFAGINNTSTGNTGGPVNYTAQVATVTTGGNYSLSVTMDPDANDYIYAWIDWNQNNILNDAGEQYILVSNSSAAGPHTVSIAVPPAAVAGNTRMRVMVDWNNATPNPCRAATYGEAEDYTVNVVSAPCAAPANGGTITASATTICPSNTLTISSTGTSYGLGTVFQWQNSPDGFVWSDIAGQTSSSFSGTQATQTNYRLRVICTNGPDTSYSNVVSVASTPFLNCYCTSNATSTVDEDIQNFTFAGINNTSPTLCNTYTDYTSVQGLAFQGLSYPISVNTADCEGANFYNRKVAVWIDYNHNGSFADPGELVFDPAYGTPASTVLFSGSVTIPNTSVTGVTRVRVVCVETTAASINACGTFTWGETEDYYLNILPPPADEAGVLAITKPEIAGCALGSQIWVNLQNLGSNPLTQANFVVKVNGINIPVNNPWTGSVAPQSIGEIQIPLTYSLADGDSVYVAVSLPNGQTEDPLLAFNNSTSRRIYAGLSGIKTVGGVSPNYVDINAALQALYQRGVCDTVFFKIASGNYTTQHTFLHYPGSGAGRLAVFESATGAASDVVYSFPATSAADNFVFKFDGGDKYLIRNLTGIGSGTAGFSTVIDIRNGADDLIFDGNTFIGDTAVAYNTGDFNGIVISSAQATTDLRTTLRNNHISGGNRAINLGGATGAYESGNVLEGNTIDKYAYIGGIFGNLSNYTIKGNTFRPRTDLTQESNAIYATGTIDGAVISANDIQSMRIGTGIFLNNVKGASQPVSVTNSFMYQGDTNSVGVSRGILVQDVNSSGIEIENNSIAIYSDNATSAGISLVDGSQILLYNNNVGAYGTSPAARVEKSYSVTASDNNNMFGTNLAYVLGTTYSTLATLQAGTSKDAHSVSVDPGFTGTDLHTCAPELNGTGMPLAAVVSDFDGDVRGTMPDIGADEFLGDANNLLVEDAFLKCPSDQVMLGNTALNGVTYAWSPSGNTSSINVTAAGTYILTATSSCGSYSDTAVVTNKPLPTASFTSFSVGLAASFDNNSTNGTTYLWDFGDGASSADVNPSHIYESEGTYSASLTVTNECGTATFGPTAIHVINAGIEESEIVNVSLFPNPTNGVFTVKLISGNASETTLNIIDVTGKTVVSKNIAAGVNQITLDASSFASGVYTVKITNIEFTKVIRFVKK